jgi:hypothetical protein
VGLLRLGKEAEVVLAVFLVAVDRVDGVVAGHLHVLLENAEVLVVDQNCASGEHCEVHVLDGIDGLDSA